MTYTEKEFQQINMFGCTTTQIREEFNNARNKKIYLMGILSDVQFFLESERVIEATKITSNQLLNKAKYIIDQLM